MYDPNQAVSAQPSCYPSTSAEKEIAACAVEKLARREAEPTFFQVLDERIAQTEGILAAYKELRSGKPIEAMSRAATDMLRRSIW